jgi:predicted MPP superfamily phosphohydrolase
MDTEEPFVNPPHQKHIHTNPRRPTLRAQVARFVGKNWARVGYAYHVEPTWLEVNRFSLPVRGLPEPFHGLKIAHLTDFHCGQHIPANYLEKVVEQTRRSGPT